MVLRAGRRKTPISYFDHTKALYNKGVALAQYKEQLPAALECFCLATRHDPRYVKA
jgi:hypothetical protein